MKHFISLGLLVCTTNAFALFCPTSFSSINYGDSAEKVQQVCGKPDTQQHFMRTASTAQEWEYFIKLHSLDQAMTKMTVLIKDNKVININIADDSFRHAQICQSIETGTHSGMIQSFCTRPRAPENVASTDVCGSIIQVGNSAHQIEFVCGKPALAKDIQTQSSQNPPVEITEYNYAGPPRVSLIFENGSLKDRNFL